MTSYTALRLEHASPEHLDITTRRTFIGPLPAGWLRSNRKHWYKDYLALVRTPSVHDPESGFDGAAESHTDETAPSRDNPPPSPPILASPSPERVEPRVETDDEAVRNHDEAQQEIVTSITSSTSLLHSQRATSGQTSRVPSSSFDPQAPSPHLLDKTRSKVSRATHVHFRDASGLQLRTRARGLASKAGLRSSTIKDGALLKVEKMLVRVDITQQHLQDFDERISQGVVTRALDKWREYMVVCRKHVDGDAQAVLQLHQTRVIAVTENQKVKSRARDQIPLSQRRVRVNLYSSLDKTLCLWTVKNGRTTIYYLKPETSASSVEWYSFLRSLMGEPRPRTLNVNIPDLSIVVSLNDPFDTTHVEEEMAKAADGDEVALMQALSHEAGAARAIVARCTKMLDKCVEWQDVLKLWSDRGHIGLAWCRYDRIEWIHGAMEHRLYGSMAMAQSHDLELRSMDHYPTAVDEVTEPRAVEGFLIRLSQSGMSRRFGKLLFKRLYFTTQNHYLVFLRPSRAVPAPPPTPTIPDRQLPSQKQLMQEVPILFDVDPYSADNFKPEWFHDTSHRKEVQKCDNYAKTDADRQLAMLLASDGFIDLCDVQDVRAVRPEQAAKQPGVSPGGDEVDFDVSVPDHAGPDGLTDEIDEDRILEILMNNGLTIHLQAFSKAMRAQWIKRLKDLVDYWSKRTKEDMKTLQIVRQQNLKALHIDERAEAVVGQFAYKWEVSQSYASPLVYNVCGISNCRAIHHSGGLYRKPRRHSTFSRCHVILSHGHMLIFQDTVRKQSGKAVATTQHVRTASIDLQGCYLYSGLLSENDLLYQNQTFDSNSPGHHTLPRVFLHDAWTSSDEDPMTTFVIWHCTSKSWFRSSKTVDDAKDKTKVKRVGKLGTTGRSVVFKARSRAERDHWVLAIQNEIERMSSSIDDDVRLAK